MKRRDFLTKTSLASSLMLVPNFMKAFEGLDPAMQGYKKLVLIQAALSFRHGIGEYIESQHI